MRMLFKMSFVGLLLIGLAACSDDSPQQVDPDFAPQNTHKSFSEKNSPVVLIDEAHNNFLTANRRYRAFAQVLESDGYTVKTSKSRFSIEHLYSADILVIANALDKSRRDWNPPFAEAFTDKEVSNVKQWVLEGGSLFLVADHTPFPKVIEKLAREFGFEFSNGHVDNAVFLAKNNSLGQHVITSGTDGAEQGLYFPTTLVGMTENIVISNRIEKVRSFGGSAFNPPSNAISLLTLGEGTVSIVPKIPFQVNDDSPRVSMNGWSQGAVLEVGKGRIAVFSEGMMFSSQLIVSTGKKHGLVSDGAEQNEQFLLNVMHWLSKVI